MAFQGMIQTFPAPVAGSISRGIYGAGNLGPNQRGRTPTSRLDYDSTAAKLFGTTKHSFQFGDQAQQAEFQQLVGDRDLNAGEYYGDYAIAKVGDQNVTPGYERVGGYMARRALTPVFTEQAIRGKESPQFTEDLQVLRRKAEAPRPAAAAASAAAPQPPAPRVEASNPSLAGALVEQRQGQGDRPALQEAIDSALRLNGEDGSRTVSRTDPETGNTITTRVDATGADATEENGAEPVRRFAASDRWRDRVAQAQSRLG